MKTTLTHRHGVLRKKKDDEGRMKKEEWEVEEEDEESRTLTRRVIARISKCVYKLGHRRLADTGTARRRGAAARRADREAGAAREERERFTGR